jgi:hypothetical protein
VAPVDVSAAAVCEIVERSTATPIVKTPADTTSRRASRARDGYKIRSIVVLLKVTLLITISV